MKRKEAEYPSESDQPSRTYRTEAEFQEAWAAMRFDRDNLRTQDHKTIRILHTGRLNHDQGPDFLDAEIEIEGQRHHGHVELHLHSDEWQKHRHDSDPGYDAVILHVYLEEGRKPVIRSDGSPVPGLRLGHRIRAAPGAQSHVPRGRPTLACAGVARAHIPPEAGLWLEMEGRARIVMKAAQFEAELAAACGDWGQVLWRALAAVIGGPVNGRQFQALADGASWELVRKYQFDPVLLEALLFGMGGMLEGRPMDAYHGQLQSEWQHLRLKHRLKAKRLPMKFHRMHPAGFPTVRLAQLAGICHRFQPLYSLLDVALARRFVEESGPVQSEYWSQRHAFGNTTTSRRNELGEDTRTRILANVLVPLGIVYLRQHLPSADPAPFMELLQELAAEQNKVVRKYLPFGLKANNCLQSQGLIHLHQSRCLPRLCLECPIGMRVLGPRDGPSGAESLRPNKKLCTFAPS